MQRILEHNVENNTGQYFVNNIIISIYTDKEMYLSVGEYGNVVKYHVKDEWRGGVVTYFNLKPRGTASNTSPVP